MAVDLVTLFAIIVFSLAWLFWSRTPPIEPVVRLFFATLMLMGALIGVFGFILKLYARGVL